MERGAGSLTYAVRPVALRYYLGRIAGVIALLMAVPLVVTMALGEFRLAVALGVTILPLAASALICRNVAAPRTLQTNEALTIVALTFVIIPLLMTLPFASTGIRLSDAFFESVSAVTTTGLSTVGTISGYGTGLLFLRAWLQWFGGLGIAVFSLALMIGHVGGARRLAGIEGTDDLSASARIYALRVLFVYVALTAVTIVALWLASGNALQSLLHALSAVSTGGFSGYEQSLAGMPSVTARWLTVGASVLGAVPLMIYYRAARRGQRRTSSDPECWLLLGAIVLVWALLTLTLRAESGLDWLQALYHGGLLGTSAQTTSGFASMPVADVGDMGKIVLIVSMLVGGSVGSTAGGIKLLRLLILARFTAFVLRQTMMPRHAVASLHLAGRRLEDYEVQRVLLVIILFASVNLISWLAIVAGGYPALPALFEVVSATSTVGLSAGIVGPELATGYKLLLCVNMLLGRLEIIALLVVLYPPTWLGRKVETL